MKYHFKEEGEKYHNVLIKLFGAVFAKFRARNVLLVRVAAQLLIAELLEKESPENVKIEGGNLFIRKKRRLI